MLTRDKVWSKASLPQLHRDPRPFALQAEISHPYSAAPGFICGLLAFSNNLTLPNGGSAGAGEAFTWDGDAKITWTGSQGYGLLFQYQKDIR